VPSLLTKTNDIQSLYSINCYLLVFILFSIYFGLSAAFCRKNCTQWKRKFLGICSSFRLLCLHRLNTVPWDSWAGRFGCGETACVNGSNSRWLRRYGFYLISNFRRVLNIVCILLGISPASNLTPGRYAKEYTQDTDLLGTACSR
jgi:hypothetical protein